MHGIAEIFSRMIPGYMLTWLTLSILSGFSQALLGFFSKLSFKNSDEYINSFALAFFGLLSLLVLFPWFDWPGGNYDFWYAAAVSIILNIVGLYFFMRSLAMEDMSLVMPLLAFTPFFIIFSSRLILGEMPSRFGVSGIGLIILGSYILNMRSPKDLMSPVKSLLLNRGSQSMLLVAFLFGISTNFDKIGVQNSNPVTYLIVVKVALALFFAIVIALGKSRKGFGVILPNLRLLLPIGVFSAISSLAYAGAINLSLVVYVVSLKRTSALFAVILGFLVLKEKNIPARLLGSLVMVLGVFLIALG